MQGGYQGMVRLGSSLRAAPLARALVRPARLHSSRRRRRSWNLLRSGRGGDRARFG